MNKKISSLLEPRLQFYFIVLLCFAALSAVFSLPVALAEAAIIFLLFLYYRIANDRRRKEIMRYIEGITFDVDSASKDTMLNSPLPMVIFNPANDEVIWSNERFLQMTGAREHLFDTKITSTVPGFSSRWLMEGKTESPTQVAFGSRQYLVFGHLVRAEKASSGRGLLATTYWIDVTELSAIRDKYFATRAVAAIIVLDNYEELMKGLSDNARSAILSHLDDRIGAWASPACGLIRKFDRDRYLFVFEEQYLELFSDGRFALLDEVREILGPNGIPATVSIGIGKDADSLEDLFQFASLSIEMALSRGGDQVVTKNRFTFEFFGGHAKELERRTKVKSRVMANALGGLVNDSTRILVMGHKSADLDSLGSAVGICALARKRGKPCHIVIEEPTLAGPLMDRLRALPEYEGAFLSSQDALVLADARTLLVVVDTSRPEQVQSEDLLLSCTRVALIDHHRRTATYIANAALTFHEIYASSAAELVTELLQYLMEPSDFLRAEAEALLAGIVLDTKSFAVRTGARTFEAAAFLRRIGADTAEVKQFFRNDLNGAIAKYDIIRTAKLYREGIAIAIAMQDVGRIAASQAADELLSIAGIAASFVLYPDQGGTSVSARSAGDINVQIICETLGNGGGNAAAAGAQLPESPPEEVDAALRKAIDKYLEEARPT